MESIYEKEPNVHSYISLYPERSRQTGQIIVVGITGSDEQDGIEGQIQQATQAVITRDWEGNLPEEAIIMVSGGWDPIKDRIEGWRKHLQDKGIKLPLTVITIDPQERQALERECKGNTRVRQIDGGLIDTRVPGSPFRWIILDENTESPFIPPMKEVIEELPRPR
ncbi:MAG: hypothetical protein LBF65_03365 [Holosporales bacterium]|jgi:hypothetical protein|nr:hypothetical protein [Holosporales bacterium]